MDEIEQVGAASKRYVTSQKAADDDKNALFEACAAAARAGLAPEEIAPHTPFTVATVRKAVRDRGVPPLPRGPKRKTTE